MPYQPPMNDKCPACDKAVYANEAKLAAGVRWHPMCFKCGPYALHQYRNGSFGPTSYLLLRSISPSFLTCSKMLDSTTVAGHEGSVYCKQCYGKQFGPKGFGFGGGAAGLGTETGPGGSDMRAGVAATLIKGPQVEGGCPRCGKRVYDAEKKVGAGKDWHKVCFKCKNCNKSLDSSTLFVNQGEIYCKNCYGKLFGPIGKH